MFPNDIRVAPTHLEIWNYHEIFVIKKPRKSREIWILFWVANLDIYKLIICENEYFAIFETWGKKYHFIGFCLTPSKMQNLMSSVSSQPFIATLNYINSSDAYHPNKLHIHIEIPHEVSICDKTKNVVQKIYMYIYWLFTYEWINNKKYLAFHFCD